MQEQRDRLKALEPAITEILAISSSPGLSLGVLHQGSVVHTAHFGRRDPSDPEPPDDDTVYRIASLTKVLTSGAVALLVEEGILSWDTPIREYLPAFKRRTDELGLKATLRDLLANRTGLPVADKIWGQQYDEFLMPKSELVRITTYFEAVGPFRKKFVFSQWNYVLVSEVVEAVTGKTLGTIEVENIAPCQALRNDGTPCKIGFMDTNDDTGLAGGFGGKSSIKDLLVMYQGLLRAQRDQMRTNLDSTPGLPFKHTSTIVSPHIAVGGFDINYMAYCLGLYRTRLPGPLSVASINKIPLGTKRLPLTGAGSPGLEVFHHTGNIPVFLASVFLIPSTQSAVVVLTNSLAFVDPTDLVGQLLLSVLIGEEPSSKIAELTRAARLTSMRAYATLSAALAAGKTTKPPRSPTTVYEGHYWNATNNFCLSVTVRPGGCS